MAGPGTSLPTLGHQWLDAPSGHQEPPGPSSLSLQHWVFIKDSDSSSSYLEAADIL